MWLKRHHTTGHTAVACFAVEQGQHGLVTPVHTVKVTDGQSTGIGQLRVMKTSKNLHKWCET
jgi:hypothetical protein